MGHALVPFILVAALSGCAAAGVGDPCIPEAIPANITPSEIYVETSAVQCRTRVCIMYHLDGNPENLQSEDCPASGGCVDDVTPLIPGTPLGPTSIHRVHCSCRCRAGADNPNLPLCACGDGYHCADEGYCVAHETDENYCSATYSGLCDGCDLSTNRCS